MATATPFRRSPGFDKKDIHLDLNNDVLTISAERHSEHEDKDKKGKFVRCERSYGTYTRQFDVSNINTDAMKAKYENGVLTLNMPKKSAQLPTAKRVEIE
ncbi:MAG: Hsp20/alpha crystallin family protein [Christensenellales bacterium]